MSSYADKLLIKTKTVLSEYKSKIVIDERKISLNATSLKVFISMKRWHANAHMSPTDWKSCFAKVKDKLDVKEKMKTLDGDLNNFLKVKFAATVLKEQFAICDVLDCLVVDIRDLYQLKLDQRDDELDDEFNVDHFFQGMKPSDLTYYKKVFLPAALFFTYLERHPDSDRRALMEDVFTVGSGSQTEDLVPEVTGLCACALCTYS